MERKREAFVIYINMLMLIISVIYLDITDNIVIVIIIIIK